MRPLLALTIPVATLSAGVTLAAALPQPPVKPAARPNAAPEQLDPVNLDTAFTRHFRWRNLGPDRGGRSIATSGVKGQPKVAYFGWERGKRGDHRSACEKGRAYLEQTRPAKDKLPEDDRELWEEVEKAVKSFDARTGAAAPP